MSEAFNMAEAKQQNKRQVTGHRPRASNVAVSVVFPSTSTNLPPTPSQQVIHHLTLILHQLLLTGASAKLTFLISDVTNENVFYVFNSMITSSSSDIDDGSSQGSAILFPKHSRCLKAEFSCGERGQGLSLALCMQ
jgi:hypothetical protein